MDIKKYKFNPVYFILLCLIILIFFIQCGCTQIYNIQIEKFLSDKYDEEFIVVRSYTVINGQSGKYVEAICHPEANENICFKVTLYKDSDKIVDLYREAVLTDEIKKEMSNEALKIADDYAIAIDLESFASDYEASVSPKQYNTENKCILYAVLAVNKNKSHSSDPDKIYNAMCNMCKSIGPVNGAIYLYYVDDDTLNEIKNYSRTHPETDSTLLDMCGDGFVFSVSDGILEKTVNEFESELI